MSNNITNNPTSGVDPYSYDSSGDTAVKKEQPQVADASTDTPVDINELIKNDPKLKELYDKVVDAFSEKPVEEKFSIQRVIASLIELSQVLQGVVVAESTRMDKISKRISAYATMQASVPVITKDQGLFAGQKDDQERDARQTLNQKFGMDLEAVRANSGVDQDLAKKVQTLMQTIKDASTSVEDFIGSFTDLLRGISSKITQ
jgi:hypothetical protein